MTLGVAAAGEVLAERLVLHGVPAEADIFRDRQGMITDADREALAPDYYGVTLIWTSANHTVPATP
jgi:hypothetical protein